MLVDRRALITGASGGIGRAICELFAKNGATLYITDRNELALADLSKELKALNANINVFYGICDLSNKTDIVALVEKAKEQMGGVDVLVGNAGMNMDTLTLKMTDEQWQKVIDVNLSANFVLSRECAKIMMKQRFGRIINMASVVGLSGNVGQANYSASKGGLISMTKCFALEYAKRGITANCIAPGFIETPMTRAMTEEARKVITARIPMDKYGTPEDVANACLFLASDMASYITGQVLSVNGGMLM